MSARCLGVILAVAALSAPELARADDAACIAASEESLVLRQKGKLRDALKQLVGCAVAACPAEIKAECSQRVEAFKAAIPTLILAAKDGAGADLSAVKVTIDGAPVEGALDGQPIALDPGEHTFRFEAAGQPPLEKKLVLRSGEKDRRETVVLGARPPPTGLTGPTPSAWSTQRTLAIVGAGIGVVGLGLGAMFGAYAASSKGREQTDCSSSGCPSYAQALEDYRTAKRDATGSTVAFAAGGALLATGVVLWFTAPKSGGAPASAGPLRVSPLVASSGGGLLLGGAL
jgi:hypothetical protein